MGNFTAAREDFTRARSVLGRINGLLQSTIKAHKEKQAKQFMEQFQRRIQNMNGTITRIQDKLEGANAQNFQNTLNRTAAKLQRLRGRLSEDELEDVLDELDDAVEATTLFVTHQGLEQGRGFNGVIQLNPEDRAGCRVHGGFP